MGFNNFISSDPNDPGSPGGPGGPGGPPMMPPMGHAAQQGADVTDLMINYNERFKSASPALFRDQLIALTMAVLISKDKPNPLLIGSAGVGKTRIVEEIARLIATKSPSVPDRLRGCTIWELPLSSIVAGGGIVGEIEQRVVDLVDFATAPKNKAIIFIDEVHLLQSNSETYRKIAQILKPSLARGDMHMIGATTGQESRRLDDDPAFARRFSRLVVDELTREQTVVILKGARDALHAHYDHKIVLSDDVLEQTALIADQNSRASAKRPDNALTLLDKAMADTMVGHSLGISSAEARGDAVLAQALRSAVPMGLGAAKVKDVAVRLMTGMPTKHSFDEAAIRSSLQVLKGQDEVLEELIDALRRDELAAFPRTRPLAWMLAGPSGVGKTAATKIIARALTDQDPIMLNMAEYDTKWSASKLLGSPPGYVGSDSDRELPFDSLESNPYRVILLDEFEKADPTIHQLLLSAFDEGWLRMASGKEIDFSKAIFVATTNAARESMSKNPLGFSAESGPRVLTRPELVKKLQAHFPAELLGRFSQLVAFKAIDRGVYAEVLRSYYARERERIVADTPRRAPLLPAVLDDDVVERIVADTYQVDQGARPAEQAARTLIEDLLLAGARPMPASAPAPAIVQGPGPDDEEERADGGPDDERQDLVDAIAQDMTSSGITSISWGDPDDEDDRDDRD